MFKIVSERTFTRDVTVMTPVDGGFKEETLKATFRVVSTTEAEQFDLTERGTTDLLTRIVMRLDDLADEHDQPVPYSDAVRDQLLAQPHVRVALQRKYFESVNKAKAGN